MQAIPDDFMSKDEKKSFFEAMQEAAKSEKAAEQLTKIKEKLLAEKGDTISHAQEDRYRRLILLADAEHHIMRFKDHTRGMLSYLVGQFSNLKETGKSVDAIKKALRSVYYRKLVKGLKSNKVFEVFMDKSNDANLADALFDRKSARDGHIKKVAEVLNEVNHSQVDMLNKSGARIKEAKNFIAHLNHNVEKMMQSSSSFLERRQTWARLMKEKKDFLETKKSMAEMAFNRWKNFIVTRLDLARTFDDENLKTGEIDKRLKLAYEVLTKGRAIGDDEATTQNSFNLARKISEHRFFHFKDGQSWMEYNKEYGSGTLRNAVINTLRVNADRIGVLQTMGANPDIFYETLKKRIIDTSDTPNIKQNINKADKYFITVLGRDQIPGSYLGAHIGNALRSMQNITKLGSVVLTSLTDTAQSLSGLRSSDVGLLTRWGYLMQGIADLGMRRELADSLGVMADSMMGHFNNRFTALDTPLGGMNKAMGIFFKLNLQDPWDFALRNGFGTALARNLANVRDISFENLGAGLRRNLLRYGIDEKDWNLIRNNREAMKSYRGKLFVTPDMIDQFTPESIAEYHGQPEATAGQIKDTKNLIEQKLQMYFMDQTDMAQIQTGASEKAMLVRGTQAGTVQGELLRTLAQFKFYTLGITRRALGRNLLENSSDGVMQSILNGNVSYKALADYMITATVFGYISMAAKSMIKSGTVPNPASIQTNIEAMVAGGGFGIYGDLLTNQYNKFGHGLIGSLAGPTAGSIADAASLFSTLVPFTDKDNHRLTYHQRALKGLTQFAQHNLLPNTFYTKAAFDHLLGENWMNHIDPGYTERMKQKIRKANKDNIPIMPFN